jgi:hypothetical protein
VAIVKQSIMATMERPTENGTQEKFGTKLIKFVARIVGLAAVAMALILFGSMLTGVLQWVLVGAGVVLFIGLGLYGSALSGETRRKLGPLPLGEPDRDLDSLPLTKQWREQRSRRSAQQAGGTADDSRS